MLTDYKNLTSQASALVDGIDDAIANQANIAALLWHALPDLNWAGFYRVVDHRLVLGPFQGQPACVLIDHGRGVCGTAWKTAQTQRIADVNRFEGHIACDPASRSELVVPVMVRGAVTGVLDLDSASPDRFSADDQAGIEQLVNAIASAVSAKTAT